MMQVADGNLGQLSQLLQSIAAGDLTTRAWRPIQRRVRSHA